MEIIFLLFFLFAHSTSRAGTLQAIESVRSHEPSLNTILNCYYTRERLDDSLLDRIAKKMKLAPYLPTLVAGYDDTLKASQSLSITDNISVSGGNVTVGPEDNNIDYAENSSQVFRVRAVWQLDQLVLHDDTLALFRERQNLAKLRNEMREKIAKIYEQRALYLQSYLQLRSSAPLKAEIAYSKFLLLTDSLDAITGNRYHNQWWSRAQQSIKMPRKPLWK